MFGSVRDDCEQMTGRCMCQPGISGTKCNICSSGRQIGPQGCSGNASPTLFTDDDKGPITSCSELVCEIYSTCQVKQGVATCVCPTQCPTPNTQPPVCGTDGQQYGSACQLKIYACRLKKSIMVASEGPCRGMNIRSRPSVSPNGPWNTRDLSRVYAWGV